MTPLTSSYSSIIREVFAEFYEVFAKFSKVFVQFSYQSHIYYLQLSDIYNNFSSSLKYATEMYLHSTQPSWKYIAAEDTSKTGRS